MPKLIVYLDQNFASNLAKANQLADWKDPDRDLFGELLTVLTEKTTEDRLICPTSDFHRQESEQSPRIKGFFWHVIAELSFDLSFKSFIEIAWSQVEKAARAYCGLAEPELLDWQMCFNRDPMESVRSMNWPPSVLVHIPTHDELLQFDKQVHEVVTTQYQQYKQSRSGKSQSFLEELDYQKRQLVLEMFLPPTLLKSYLPGYGELVLLGAIGVMERQARVYEILGRSPDPLGFLDSIQLKEVPFLHTRASLMAADIFHTPAAIPKSSFNTDFEIISSVLPYVDVIATDGHIAETIRRAKLDVQFGTRVFSMAQRVEFLEFIKGL